MSNVTSCGVVSVCGHGGWDLTRSVTAMAVVGLALALPPPVQADTFDCGAGDVQCLIAAINDANANGQENTIRLEAGIYTLTNVDNDTNGPNGLPSITSSLGIEGAGPDATTVARDASAPGFRLLHVGPTGNLTVDGLTLTGGEGQSATPGGGLFNNGGVVTVTQSVVSGNPGGGLVNNGGVVTITGSTVSDNGGPLSTVGALSNSGGVVTITQSSVSGNRGSIGAGLVNNGEVNITQCTFDNNFGRGPGGLFTSGTGSTGAHHPEPL
jgi:parallel beta helix pectate lyase-like protein